MLNTDLIRAELWFGLRFCIELVSLGLGEGRGYVPGHEIMSAMVVFGGWGGGGCPG